MSVNCYTLTLSDFIKCLVDNDFTPLGENAPTKWAAILEEFAELVPNKIATEILELQKEISIKEKQIEIINICIYGLSLRYNRDLANELKSMGYRVKLDPANKAQYVKDLEMVAARAKTLQHDIIVKQKELDALAGTATGGRKYTHKDFISINIELGKHAGYRIDPNVVTVAEWAVLKHKYELYIEELERRAENKRRALVRD